MSRLRRKKPASDFCCTDNEEAQLVTALWDDNTIWQTGDSDHSARSLVEKDQLG